MIRLLSYQPLPSSNRFLVGLASHMECNSLGNENKRVGHLPIDFIQGISSSTQSQAQGAVTPNSEVCCLRNYE